MTDLNYRLTGRDSYDRPCLKDNSQNGIREAVKYLCELEDRIQAGTLLQSPVAPKDYIYIPHPVARDSQNIYEEQVTEITFFNKDPDYGWHITTNHRSISKYAGWQLCAFPTRAEALDEIIRNPHNLFRKP